MQTFIVMGRRWFDGSNTYHKIRVVCVGPRGPVELDCGESMSYGGGSMFEQTARAVLVSAGRLPSNCHPALRWACEDNKIALVVDVVDVARKRDL